MGLSDYYLDSIPPGLKNQFVSSLGCYVDHVCGSQPQLGKSQALSATACPAVSHRPAQNPWTCETRAIEAEPQRQLSTAFSNKELDVGFCGNMWAMQIDGSQVEPCRSWVWCIPFTSRAQLTTGGTGSQPLGKHLQV